MPQNDAATDRRISRLSLISSATRLFAGKDIEPSAILEAAQQWESWVYAVQDMPSTATVTQAPAPAIPQTVCAECGQLLTPVTFKNGSNWPVEQLANQSMAKYGRVLCKTHYFGRKPAAA